MELCEDWMLIISSTVPSLIIFLITRYYYVTKVESIKFYFNNLIEEMERFV